MAVLLKGASVSASIYAESANKIAELKNAGVQPGLAIVRVGETPDDIYYEKMATKKAQEIGVIVTHYTLGLDASQEEIEETILNINANAEIHGCLMLRPLPDGIDEQKICDLLLPEKDIDGISSVSLGNIFMDSEGASENSYAPCTAGACLKMLDHYGISVQGKKICVVGRSLVIGKPVAMMLLGLNATVTICHSRTKDLSGVVKDADIVICAIGRAKMFDSSYFSKGQVVLDVGINYHDGKMCGDANFEEALDVIGETGCITPVPGGIGSVTTAVLLENLICATQAALAKTKVTTATVCDSEK